jgi:tryptophan synthase alpha chain
MELQIPFSEPIADGPVILKANQQALANGTTVDQCMDFGGRVAGEFSIPVSVHDLLQYSLPNTGGRALPSRRRKPACSGAIVPDLPPEEAAITWRPWRPTTRLPLSSFILPPPRTSACMIAPVADGFVYCVARKGVTGDRTAFSRQPANLPGPLPQGHGRPPLGGGFRRQGQSGRHFLRGKPMSP